MSYNSRGDSDEHAHRHSYAFKKNNQQLTCQVYKENTISAFRAPLLALKNNDFITTDVYHLPMSLLLDSRADVSHRHTVLSNDLNGYHIMHGGRMLTLCDEVAYVAAQRHADCDCLTRAVHRARFHRSVKQGDHIIIRAKVGYTGHTSLWVAVEISLANDDAPSMDAVFVFTAIDKQRHPKPVPAFTPHNQAEKKLRQQLHAMHEQLAGAV